MISWVKELKLNPGVRHPEGSAALASHTLQCVEEDGTTRGVFSRGGGINSRLMENLGKSQSSMRCVEIINGSLEDSQGILLGLQRLNLQTETQRGRMQNQICATGEERWLHQRAQLLHQHDNDINK